MNEITPKNYYVQCAIPGCDNEFPNDEMASLTDKNGEGWQICPPCVDGMWARKPWTPPEDTPARNTSVVEIQSAMALPALVGAMTVLVDMLKPTDADAFIIRRMYDELNSAKSVYNV